jgi:hypothetical protein
MLQARQVHDAGKPLLGLLDMLQLACSMQMTQQRHQAASLLLDAIYDNTSKDKQEAASAAWKQWVTEQLDADFAESLFLAAVAQGNAAAVKALETVEPAAVSDVVFGNTLADAVEHRQATLLQALCQHSGMRTATASVQQLVVALLLASLEDGYTQGVEHLLLTNTAVQDRLQHSQISQLLLAALQAKNEECVRLLLQLPGVRQLQPPQISQLLVVALQAKDEECVRLLLQLPGVQQLQPPQISQLLVVALQAKHEECARRLLQVPGSQQLQPSQISDVLLAALRANDEKCVRLLLQLPGGQQLAACGRHRCC